MAKTPISPKTEEEVDKYPDGTPIKKYPKWIYPNGPGKEGSYLVNSKEEEDEKSGVKKDEKAAGWDKN